MNEDNLMRAFHELQDAAAGDDSRSPRRLERADDSEVGRSDSGDEIGSKRASRSGRHVHLGQSRPRRRRRHEVFGLELQAQELHERRRREVPAVDARRRDFHSTSAERNVKTRRGTVENTVLLRARDADVGTSSGQVPQRRVERRFRSVEVLRDGVRAEK